MLKIVNQGSSLTIVNEGSSLKIVNERSSLTTVNEGLSLTIVNETKNFIKTVVFGEKNYMQLYWMSSSMKFNSCGELKLLDIFLKVKNYLSTYALQVSFLSSLTIVNEGSLLTIVNVTTNFIKTIVLKTTIF